VYIAKFHVLASTYICVSIPYPEKTKNMPKEKRNANTFSQKNPGTKTVHNWPSVNTQHNYTQVAFAQTNMILKNTITPLFVLPLGTQALTSHKSQGDSMLSAKI